MVVVRESLRKGWTLEKIFLILGLNVRSTLEGRRMNVIL